MILRRPRSWLFGALLGVVGLCVVPARAEDEPPVPRPPVPDEIVLPTVVSDPLGEASRLATQAAEALGQDKPDVAAARLAQLADDHPDVLLPTGPFQGPRSGETDGALRWPTWRLVNHALARLPEAARATVLEQWAPFVKTLRKRALRGPDPEGALETLATRYAVTPEGGQALLLLARRDLEADHALRAIGRLRTWLSLHPEATPAARAAVAVRLVDALATLDDAGAIERLGVFEQDVRDVRVDVGGATTTLADRIATWRARPIEAPDTVDGPRPAPWQAEGLRRLWSRSLDDPGYLRHLGYWPFQSVQAGAWGRGDTLVVHEGRVVRRLDLLTGRERWRFPDDQLVTIHDPRERYRAFDLPWRAVTPAGDSVLVVLGDPSAVGRYTFLDSEYEADRLGRECRLRLASLDLATGALQWFTGAANDAHPILGDRATGCASPPLVVGDDVYCLFARRKGATTFHLACLDRATGEARWVTALAAGESGRNDDQSRTRDRFTSLYVQSVPWGARPSLAGDELCVTPHAGFAAGVQVADGQVRWLRALPRYALDAFVPASTGHHVRNAPLAFGDAWIIAAMDSPRLCCLARGSGTLRWQRGQPGADGPPAWRDLLGIQLNAEGRPRLHLSGWKPQMMNPADGALEEPPALFDWSVNGGDPGGMALDLGTHVARASDGVIQIQAWERRRDETSFVPMFLPDPDGPDAGDLLRIGDVWIVIGADRMTAVADPSALQHADLPSGGAAERGLHALLLWDPEAFGPALDAAHALFPGALRANTFTTLQDQMRRFVLEIEGEDEELRGLQTLAPMVKRLPVRLRGDVYRALSLRFIDLGQQGRAAALLLAWLDSGDRTLLTAHVHRRDDDRWVPREAERGEGTALHQRGDLVAASLLRGIRGHAEVVPMLDARETLAKAGFDALERDDEAGALRLRRAKVGTQALDAWRTREARRLEADERYAAAAAYVADRRLDPPWSVEDLDRSARLLRTMSLQLEEARLLAEAGAGDRARTLIADLERYAPEGAQDAEGRTLVEVAADLRRRFGWYPVRARGAAELDVWPEGMPVERDKLRSVEFLGLTGPGADALGAKYVLLVRGITLEVWSLETGKRIASLPGGDQGWFGGSLSSVERWVPGGGILVSSVVAGEPADGSGVADGDWVRRWDGREVRDLPAFMQLVAASKPGVEIPVGVWRNGREVLSRFQTGRRPAAQGRLLTYPPLHVDAQGRVLVPGRTGLSLVDARAGTRQPLWQWTEAGVLRKTDVLGGIAYVTIQRGLRPHLVVAVDPQTGQERWRVSVQGRISHLECVGSALAIHSFAPEQSTLVDRRDGSVRVRARCFDMHRREFRRTWIDDRPAAHAVGRSFVVQGTDHQHHLLVVNTTRGTVEAEDRWAHPNRARFMRFVNPQVAAGAYAAVVRAPGLKLYFPDPLGEEAPQGVLLSGNDVSAQQGNLGGIDDESRIYLCGHRLYVVRLPLSGRKNVNAGIFHVDYAGLKGRDVTERESNGDVIHMSTQKIWMAGSASPERYVLYARASFEGIFVGASRLRGEHLAEHYWVVGRDRDEVGPDDHVNVRLFEGEVREARRHPPVRSGPWLFVPTDQGARRFPVGRMR